MAKISKSMMLALGMAALAGENNLFDVPRPQKKVIPYKPDKGKTLSAGKPKKKEFGARKLSRKQRKKLTEKE